MSIHSSNLQGRGKRSLTMAMKSSRSLAWWREALSLNFNSSNIYPNLLFNGSNGTVSWATFVSGSTYDFDGVDDYIELNDGMTIKSISIAAKESNVQAITFKPDWTMFFIVWVGSDEVHKYTLSTAWDVSTAIFSESSTVVAARETQPTDVVFNTDGTKMYVCGVTGVDITYFTLSTPYSLASLSYVGEFSVAWQDILPKSLTFNATWTKFFIVWDSTNAIYQYSLGTAYDMSTASYDSVSFSVVAQDSQPQWMQFNADGTKMFVSWVVGIDISVYTLPTPYILTGATVDSVAFYTWGQATAPNGIFFKPDWLSLYVACALTDTIYQYNLYSAYSFSNPIYSNGFTIIADIKPDTAGEASIWFILNKALATGAECWFYYWMWANLVSLKIGDRGWVWALVSSAAWITYWVTYRIAVSVSSAWLVTHYINGAVSGTPASTGTPNNITIPSNLWIGNDSTLARTFDWYIGNGRLVSRVLTATEIAADYAAVNNPSIVWDSSGNQRHGLVSGPVYTPGGGINGGGVYDFDWVDDYIELNDGMTIKELLISGTETGGSGIHMKPDGTAVFLVGFLNDTIRRYVLSTPYDISTWVWSWSMPVGTEDATMNDLWISPDGTKLYMTGTTNDRVYYYTFGTAWSLGTLTYVNSFLVSSEELDPTAIYVKPDGTKFWIVGTINDTIYEYTMGTPWDITTSVYSGNSLLVSSVDATVNGIRFHPDGTKFYLLGTTADILTEYSCTAWTIVGAVATWAKIYLWAIAATARAFDFWDSWNKLYVLDDWTDKIFQYNLYTPYAFSNPKYANGFCTIFDIKPDSSGEWSAGKIFDHTHNSGITNGLSLYMGASSVVAQVWGGTWRSSGAASITFWQKYRCACNVSSAGLVSWYLNGVAAWVPWLSNAPALINQAWPSRIGNRSFATDFTFDWYIGPVRIITREMTATEIAADYAALTMPRAFSWIPNLTTTMRNAIITPPSGMVIFNLTTNTYQTWNGSAWA